MTAFGWECLYSYRLIDIREDCIAPGVYEDKDSKQTTIERKLNATNQRLSTVVLLVLIVKESASDTMRDITLC